MVASNTARNEETAANDKSSWDELSSVIQNRFTELTQDDLQKLKGRADRLVTLVQERYALTLEDARRQVSEFEQNLEENASKLYQAASDGIGGRYRRARENVNEFANEVRTFGIGTTAVNVARTYPITVVASAFVLGALLAGTTVRTRRRRWY